jgi:hypothetical protein
MSNPDATGEAAESIGGGEAVGMPSLGQAAPVAWPRRWARARP